MRLPPILFSVLVACSATDPDEPLDAEDSAFSGPKQDGFCVEPGSPEARGILALVNDEATTLEELDRPVRDGGAGLNRIAAENIVAERPLETLEELDAVPFVGVSACESLRDYACDVEGLCKTCDPETFPPRPARTSYDSGCEALLLDLLRSMPGSGERTTLVDAGGRCEQLTSVQLTAFDAVATSFGTLPGEFSEIFGEFSVEAFGTTPQLVHVIEEDNFVPFHVLFDGDALAAIWVSDGLSADTTWFCGGEGEPADEPDEFCVGALTDDAAWCAPAAMEPLAMTVGEARAMATLSAAAVVAFADTHGLPDEEEVELAAGVCNGVAAFVEIDGETYHVVDSVRGLGLTTLTRTTADGTEILCHNPNV
jgi:hypothetical protein